MFKAGDRVRCINGRFRRAYLLEGKEYTVSRAIGAGDEEFVSLEGQGKADHKASRFELIEGSADSSDTEGECTCPKEVWMSGCKCGAIEPYKQKY